jgi:hypothetical protein
MKLISPYKSIQNRLAPYDLTPQAACISDFYNQPTKNRKGVTTPLLKNLGLFTQPTENEPTSEVTSKTLGN